MSTPAPDPESHLSRRAALLRAVAAGLAVTALPANGQPAPDPQPIEEEKFTPENDYPFFGYDPVDR